MEKIKKYRKLKWIATQVKSRPIKITFYDKKGNKILIPAIETYDAKKQNKIKQKTSTKQKP